MRQVGLHRSFALTRKGLPKVLTKGLMRSVGLRHLVKHNTQRLTSNLKACRTDVETAPVMNHSLYVPWCRVVLVIARD